MLLRKPVTDTRIALRSFVANACQDRFLGHQQHERVEFETCAYLFVKFNVDRFEMLLDVASGVLVLLLGKRHALGCLLWFEVTSGGFRHCIKVHVRVLGVSNLLEFYV